MTLRVKNRNATVILSIIILVFIILKIQHITYISSDENVYFYMGKLVSQGLVPYKDFLFSHPPLQIYLFAALLKLGLGFTAIKSVALFSTIITAIFIFKIAEDKKVIGVVASAIFLFSTDIFFSGSVNFGVNLTMMLLTVGFYLWYCRKRYFLSGLLFGLASVTGLYSLITIAAIIIITSLNSKTKIYSKDLLSSNTAKVILGFLTIFIPTNILFYIISDGAYLTQVFFYHILKSSTSILGRLDIIFQAAYNNWLLFLAPILYLFAKKSGKINVLLVISLTHFILILSLSRPFSLYFFLIYPFLAIIGSYSILNISRKLKPWYSIAIILILLSLTSSSTLSKNNTYKGSYIIGSADKISGYITSNTDKHDTIFGDNIITPLIAFLSDRDIEADMIDIHPELLNSGTITVGSITESIKNAKYIILARRMIEGEEKGIGMWDIPEIKEALSQKCRKETVFKEKKSSYYVMGCGIEDKIQS